MRGRTRGRLAETFGLGQSIVNLAAGTARRQRYIRLARAFSLVLFVMAVGAYGYWRLTGGTRGIIECLYMTVITISTVGFNEVIPVEGDALRVFTMVIIFIGGASIAYTLTAIAAVIVEGDLLYSVWRRRLWKRIGRQRDHVIVCGLGPTGRRTFAQLGGHRVPVVGLDHDEAMAEALLFEQGNQQGDTLFLIGDCFDEDTLRAARVDRARGVVAALSDDRDNLLLGLTARALNPDLRIVMRVKDPANAPMLAEVAGAVQVEPAARSGVRMAQEILHPTHLSLVDSIVDSDARRRGIEAFEVDPASLVAGMTLGSAGLQAKTGCVVVGCRGATGGPYRYNPAPDTVLAADVGLLALGSARARRTLRRLLAASKASKHHGGAA